MYLEYFSLERPPFRITPDPSLFYPGGDDGRGVVLEALVYGITSGEGILKVVGEVGSGKTMLCRMLENELPETVEIVYLANPNLSAREILYAVAFELNLDVSATTDRLQVMHKLQEFLLEKHSQGNTVVVFIEEAQGMPLETLEEIRLLSNLETHRDKLMQIVLFGQPELDKKLNEKSIRQLKERITHNFYLEPFSIESTGEYIQFRLQTAGCPWENIFTAGAEKRLARVSKGLTRRINILADKALLAAYSDPSNFGGAADKGKYDHPVVLPRHVKQAIQDSEFNAGGMFRWSAISVLLIFALLGSFKLWQNYEEESQVLVETPALGLAEITEPADIAETLVEPVVESISEPIPEQRPEISVVTRTDTREEEQNTGAGQLIIIEEQIENFNNLENLVSDESEEISAIEAGAAALLSDNQLLNEFEQDEVRDEVAIEEADVIQQELTEDQLVSEALEGLMVNSISELNSDLVNSRIASSQEWLSTSQEQNDYTLQLLSVEMDNDTGVEQAFLVLETEGLLEDSYICFLPYESRQNGRWLILFNSFSGVTPARQSIEQLPEYVRQFGPYVRNKNDLNCFLP